MSYEYDGYTPFSTMGSSSATIKSVAFTTENTVTTSKEEATKAFSSVEIKTEAGESEVDLRIDQTGVEIIAKTFPGCYLSWHEVTMLAEGRNISVNKQRYTQIRNDLWDAEAEVRQLRLENAELREYQKEDQDTEVVLEEMVSE